MEPASQCELASMSAGNGFLTQGPVCTAAEHCRTQ